MEFPYTLPKEVAIQIYFGTMDSLTYLSLRRLPPRDIDTIEKVFKEAIEFMKQVTAAPMPTITYSGYEPQKTIFFEKKTSPPTKLENNMASEVKAMKKMISLFPNKLMKINLKSSRNQGNYPKKLASQNNYSQN